MTDLRERLRATDPARDAMPLDEVEQAAIRRAMRTAGPVPRRSRVWAVASMVLAAAAAVILAVLVLRPGPTSSPVAPTVITPPVLPARVAPAEQPVPTVAEVRPKAPARRAAPKPEKVETRQVRFVTANGTQILWTLRSTQEGA